MTSEVLVAAQSSPQAWAIDWSRLATQSEPQLVGLMLTARCPCGIDNDVFTGSRIGRPQLIRD